MGEGFCSRRGQEVWFGVLRSLNSPRQQDKPQRSDAANLRGIPSALAEIQRNPEQSEPPNMISRYAVPQGSRGW